MWEGETNLLGKKKQKDCEIPCRFTGVGRNKCTEEKSERQRDKKKS